MHPRVLKSVADFGTILVLLESTRQLCDSRKGGCDVTFGIMKWLHSLKTNIAPQIDGFQ